MILTVRLNRSFDLWSPIRLVHYLYLVNEFQGEEILADPEVHEHERDSGEGAGCVRPQHDTLQGLVQSGGKKTFLFYTRCFGLFFLLLEM
jgi:hypothetical protein